MVLYPHGTKTKCLIFRQDYIHQNKNNTKHVNTRENHFYTRFYYFHVCKQGKMLKSASTKLNLKGYKFGKLSHIVDRNVFCFRTSSNTPKHKIEVVLARRECKTHLEYLFTVTLHVILRYSTCPNFKKCYHFYQVVTIDKTVHGHRLVHILSRKTCTDLRKTCKGYENSTKNTSTYLRDTSKWRRLTQTLEQQPKFAGQKRHTSIKTTWLMLPR